MKLKIITVPNPILKTKASKVSIFGNATKKLIQNMIETLRANNGIGLAANQVGEPLRIIVIESRFDEEEKGLKNIPLTIIINPEMIKHGNEKEIDVEGCLSVPNVWGDVSRYKNIVVKGLDENGKTLKIKTGGLFARVLQHEIDHLDGFIFTDRVDDLSTLHQIGEDGEKIPINLPEL